MKLVLIDTEVFLGVKPRGATTRHTFQTAEADVPEVVHSMPADAVLTFERHGKLFVELKGGRLVQLISDVPDQRPQGDGKIDRSSCYGR